jgi:glycerol-3-phosphate acyltransferase PlsY
MTTLHATLAVLLAYLIGAIPTAYLLVKAARGVDIRTLGSGNVGATNAGRILGPRGFLAVFGIDLLKGLLPTLLLPIAVRALSGREVPSLPVFLAAAAIVGHNFPIYLGFKGGKGVATSLGAVTAIDPRAAVAAALAFAVLLVATRMVSASSLAGGVVFTAVHFLLIRDPWGRDQVVTSVAIVVLLVLLFVRHRENIVRIANGTERKLSFRKRRPPSGRVRPLLLLGLAALVIGGFVVLRMRQPAELDCGRFLLAAADRASTGHQRAERVAFLDRGRTLAVTCPRYDRLVLYRVTEDRRLERHRDVVLDGKPVSIRASSDRLHVLQRPSGDARHLEPGFLRTYDFEGRPLGPKFAVGWDPDDLVLTPDGRAALVILSGHAEGETNRPAPSLVTIDLIDADHPRLVAEVPFEGPGDDPSRIDLSALGTHAAVTLLGSKQVVGFDLSDPLHPQATGRSALATIEAPYYSKSEADAMLMPVSAEGDWLAFSPPGQRPSRAAVVKEYLVRTITDDSCLEVRHSLTHRPIGRFPLRGPANLGTIRPLGLDYSHDRGILAVADRSGGVHLVEIRGQVESKAIATTPSATRR